MITLETNRLFMREFLPEDAPGMFELNNDPEVMLYTGDVPFANEAAALNLINTYDQYKKYQLGRLAVIRKADGIFMGWCGLKYMEETQEVDLGFRLKKEYWGMGYATEASLACLHYGFSFDHINTIIGRSWINNKASIRVLEKTGMKRVKEFIYNEHPCFYYAIHKEKDHPKND
jgi:RimJ/RimL family protein N-acetyltransferase